MGLLSKKRVRNSSTGRNYAVDSKYESSPEQKKKRAARGRARYSLMKAGKVKKGDGKDVDHINGNALMNRPSNLQVTTEADNRSFPRVKGAKKKFQTA